MQNSPLSRLPLELLDHILDYIIPLKVRQMDDSMNKNVAQIVDPAEKLLLMLARRHGFAATCHELQYLSLRHHLRHTEIIWNLGQATSDVFRASIPFTSLSFLYSRGILDSVRGVGVIQSDDFLQGLDKWIDEPYKLVGIYEKVLLAARGLRRVQRQRGLGHHQIFYRHTYSCISYTNGNALRPIKKALRRTWKRDTIDLTIDMLDTAISLRRLEKAFALLDIEHSEKIEAIKTECKRQEESSLRNGDSIFEDEHTLYEPALYYMEAIYDCWKRRVRHFHEGLVAVVMSGYRFDCGDLEAGLKLVRTFFEPMQPRSHSGRRVADAVIDMVNSTEVHEGQSNLQLKRT